MAQEVTLMATGDVSIDREQPKTMFQHTADVLRSADITFAQLEQNYSGIGTPTALHPTRNDPNNIPALNHAGLDVVSLAGNHSMDWGPEAIVETMKRLKEAGMEPLGVGKNLAEARKPVILERKGTKIAFLGYGCTGPEVCEADENKTGYAPMRAWTLYKQLDYQPGTPPVILTFPNKEDLEAMVNDIKAARAKADIVVASYHWGIHLIPAVIPMYEFDVAHAAIDAGADLILGHHPHILKGIEVYKGKVIVHSMGNFALELPPKRREGFVFLRDVISKLYAQYQPKSYPEYPNYPFHPECRATMIVKVIIAQKAIKRVSYLPGYINKNAEPEIHGRNSPRGQEVFSYMEKITRDQSLNTTYAWDGDEVVVSG